MRRAIADDDTAGLKGDVHPLMQIQRHRIGPLNTVQQPADALGQHGNRPDRPVHVEPQAFTLAQVGQRIEIVYCPRVDSTCIGNDANGFLARLRGPSTMAASNAARSMR